MLTYRRELDKAHRLTLSLGLSLTLDILGGFLLNMLPMGLRAQSWIALLSCLALIFAIATLYTRRGVMPLERERQGALPVLGQQWMAAIEQQETMPLGGQPIVRSGDRKGLAYMSRSRIWVGVRSGIVFAFALTIVILSLLYATQGVAEQPRPGFTQLWMLPLSNTTQNCAVNVGIRSFENGPATYHAVMTINGVQIMSWSALALAPNQVWERSIAITPTKTKNMLVKVILYMNDKPTVVYRAVHMTLNVLSNAQKVVHCGT